MHALQLPRVPSHTPTVVGATARREGATSSGKQQRVTRARGKGRVSDGGASPAAGELSRHAPPLLTPAQWALVRDPFGSSQAMIKELS